MRKNRFPFSHPKQSRLLPNTAWAGQPMPAHLAAATAVHTGTFWRTPKQTYFQWKLHQGVLCHQLSVQSSFCAWASLDAHQASPQHPTELLFGTSHPGTLGRSLNKLLSLQTSINLHYHLLQLLPNISPLPEGSQSGHNSLLSQGVNVLKQMDSFSLSFTSQPQVFRQRNSFYAGGKVDQR